MRDDLLAWYAEHGRALPWRATRDPYAILVSEVMLQQTQVVRVLPRWERWLRRWPEPSAVAARAGRRGPGRMERPGLQPARPAAARGLRDGGRGRLARRPDTPARAWAPTPRRQCGPSPSTSRSCRSTPTSRRVFARAGADERPARARPRADGPGATICTARRPRCDACPLTGCPTRGRVAEAPGRRRRCAPALRRHRPLRARAGRRRAGGAGPAPRPGGRPHRARAGGARARRPGRP